MTAESNKIISNQPKKWTATSLSGGNCVYGLVQYLYDGRQNYYFIQVSPSKEKSFLKALDGYESFILETFGLVIARGEGEPDQKTKDMLLHDYGVDA